MRLSTLSSTLRLIATICLALGLIEPANSADLAKPFKDDLFGYETILETADGGDWRIVDYNEMRDINGRDDVPERRVKRAYVSLGVKRAQANETIAASGHTIEVFRAGRAKNAAFTVVFIHGRGGDRRLGANDFSFGGNFNRLKNLAVDNGGVYYAPSVKTFDASGVAGIAVLIAEAARRAPGRPVILACASMGSFLCWGAAREPSVVADLAGMVIMGGATDPDFIKSAAFLKRLPIYFTHGSADSVYPAAAQEDLYRRLKKQSYPTRFVLFHTGSHGTPVRMTDWRDVLNWIGTR